MNKPAPEQAQWVVVTGASSGIGRYCASALSRDGYRVIATVRRDAEAASLESEGLTVVQLDLANPASVAAAASAIIERTGGRAFGLFNNAGFGQPGALEDISRLALREQFEVNLFGLHDLTVRLLPALEAASGHVVLNSSLLGYVGLRFRGPYVASKYALEGWADCLRQELHDRGVSVTLIQPGPVVSDFRRNSVKAWRRHVEPEQSRFRDMYERVAARLENDAEEAPFTLGEDAVYHRLLATLRSDKPAPRQPVTVPAHLFAWFRRLFPTRILDRVLLAASAGELKLKGPGRKE